MDNSIGYDKTMTGGDSEQRQALADGQAFGQYRIVRLLGRGGMGEVYKAEHTTLGKVYALKLLPPEFSSSYDAITRFKREAKVMAQLEHPNIIRVDESGITDGIYWLRMELAQKFVLGEHPCHSLADLVSANGEQLQPENLFVFLRQILSGLALAHSRGVVHRDLKPANILLSVDDPSKFRGWEDIRVKISDFGLALLVGEDWLRSRVEASVRISMSIGLQATQDGRKSSSSGSSSRALLGTFEYMSPEQKKGLEADARSDVYAVGVMAYRLVTGRQMSPKSPSKLVKGLDPAWDDFIEKALEEQAGDRYRDAGEMLAALERLSAEARQRHQTAIVAEQARQAQEAEAKRQAELAKASRINLSNATPVVKPAISAEPASREPVEKHPVPPAVPSEPDEAALVAAAKERLRQQRQAEEEKRRLEEEKRKQKTRRQQEEERKQAILRAAELKALQELQEEELQDARRLVANSAKQWQEMLVSGPKHVLLGNVKLELIPCPAGVFMMGSPVNETGRSGNETLHQVTISRPFWLGKTEVTQGQWQAVMGNNPSETKGLDLPVTDVYWDDAVAFCKKLNELGRGRLPDGYEYRLPTEAEWEYACRACSTGPYAGTGRLDDMGWYDGNSGNTTPPVAQKQPNAWGLYDMHGNVWEWCYDSYGDYPAPAGPAIDPVGPASGARRVSRGGSWCSNASDCRAANRDWNGPGCCYGHLGFRVALAPAPAVR